MEQDGERYRECRDIWTDYNARQEFEHALIDRKTTWWLTTQTILIAAYGVTFDSNSCAGLVAASRTIVAAAGIALAVITLVGVLAVIISKWLSWRSYEAFHRRFPSCLPRPLDEASLQWGVKTLNTPVTLVPDILSPFVFLAARAALLRS